MDLQLGGKTALVTGASRGNGRAIALGLAKEGVKLAVAARGVNLLEELAREIVSARGAEPLIIEAVSIRLLGRRPWRTWLPSRRTITQRRSPCLGRCRAAGRD